MLVTKARVFTSFSWKPSSQNTANLYDPLPSSRRELCGLRAVARDDGWRRMKEKVVGCNTPLDFKLLQTYSLKLVNGDCISHTIY